MVTDLVDQEHRIAMRQDFHDFFYVEFHKCFLLENDGVLIDDDYRSQAKGFLQG